MREAKNIEEICADATVENIGRVTEFVDRRLEESGCPRKAQMQIDIAIDEIFGNIVHYAYSPEAGPVIIQVGMTEEPLGVVIAFIDYGIPYNPLAKEDPDVNLSLEKREAGGLGVYMVKKIMDEISYERRDGRNILKIKKKF